MAIILLAPLLSCDLLSNRKHIKDRQFRSVAESLATVSRLGFCKSP